MFPSSSPLVAEGDRISCCRIWRIEYFKYPCRGNLPSDTSSSSKPRPILHHEGSRWLIVFRYVSKRINSTEEHSPQSMNSLDVGIIYFYHWMMSSYYFIYLLYLIYCENYVRVEFGRKVIIIKGFFRKVSYKRYSIF